jgi:hypothetical protein
MGISLTLTFAIALGYVALRIWRQRNASDGTGKNAGFRPRIGFSRLDGMASLSLLLENRSSNFVWAEEIEIFLSGLKAIDQTAEPALRGVLKIRQMVRSGDTLPISLCEVIYKAAGDPQRKYTCVLSSVLRYRIGKEWFEKQMDSYRVGMMGLTAATVHRERKPVPSFPVQEKPQDIPAEATRQK